VLLKFTLRMYVADSISACQLPRRDSVEILHCACALQIPFPHVNSEDEVLLRVSHAGICGTDLHIISVGLEKFMESHSSFAR
jgi:hypothetical protein